MKQQLKETSDTDTDNHVVGPVSAPPVPSGACPVPEFSSALDTGVKLPRDVSGKDAVKALRRLGFTVTRQHGSHIRMSKGGLHVTVPNHRAILPKTLQNVLRQAGVTVEEFLGEL